MISKRAIEEWAEFLPWKTKDFIEQDLIICRALCELYNDEYLSEHLAFRGGTTLNKIYLNPQPRYSEDIDLVQINAEPIKETIDKIRNVLSFLGKPIIKQKAHNNTLIFRFNILHRNTHLLNILGKNVNVPPSANYFAGMEIIINSTEEAITGRFTNLDGTTFTHPITTINANTFSFIMPARHINLIVE